MTARMFTEADARQLLAETLADRGLIEVVAPTTAGLAEYLLDVLAEHGYRLVSEADVLGWVVVDKRGHAYPMIDGSDGGRESADTQASHLSRVRSHRAPHRVCAVVPWPHKEDNDD